MATSARRQENRVGLEEDDRIMKRKLTAEEIEILKNYQSKGCDSFCLSGDRNVVEFYYTAKNWNPKSDELTTCSFYFPIGRQPGRPFGDIPKFQNYIIKQLLFVGLIEGGQG